MVRKVLVVFIIITRGCYRHSFESIVPSPSLSSNMKGGSLKLAVVAPSVVSLLQTFMSLSVHSFNPLSHLTDNSQLNAVFPGRSGGDLALVEPLVPRRHGLDPQLPEVCEGDVVHREALVRRVGVLIVGVDSIGFLWMNLHSFVCWVTL